MNQFLIRLNSDARSRRKTWLERRWSRAETDQLAATGGYRTPLQVCPRGCAHELARRTVATRTRLMGRAEILVSHHFETTNCAVCGSKMQRNCSRCEKRIYAPLSDRCENCGLPQPWAAER